MQKTLRSGFRDILQQLRANGNYGTDNLMCVAEVYLDPNHNVARMQSLFRDTIYASPLTKTHQPVVLH